MARVSNKSNATYGSVWIVFADVAVELTLRGFPGHLWDCEFLKRGASTTKKNFPPVHVKTPFRSIDVSAAAHRLAHDRQVSQRSELDASLKSVASRPNSLPRVFIA